MLERNNSIVLAILQLVYKLNKTLPPLGFITKFLTTLAGIPATILSEGTSFTTWEDDNINTLLM